MVKRYQTALAAALFLSAGVTTVSRAGDIDPPPGPVGATMKTLGEIEPRIPIKSSDLPLTINEPGSYYLAEPITTTGGGVTIVTDDVTIDLMGFTLRGGAGGGIYAMPPRRGITVVNGTIAGWSGHGLDLSGVSEACVRWVRAADNTGAGIRVGTAGVVEQSGARGNGGYGIETASSSIVVDSIATENGSDGIHTTSGCRVKDCVAQSNSGNGIYVDLASSVRTSTAKSNTLDGIHAGAGAEIAGNTASSNTGDGIEVSRDCRVVGNACDDNGLNGNGAGVHITSADNRIEDNHATDNDRGLDIDFGGNLIIRNTASGNGTSASSNFDIQGGNAVGQIIELTGGGAVAGVDPWANFSF